MCRNCPVPEWGEPTRVPVSELPQYFSKEISWNFERLNFGNGAVMDNELEKPMRPTVTGKVGCRLRDGMPPVSKDRFLLVSECLFCPGRRYGCTPRANCTGKRRNCWAQCKVSVYADFPDIAEVYYSGNHGEGNINDVNKHRPRPGIVNELKRKRRDGASPGEALQWFKKCVEEQGLDANDPREVPTDTQIKAMLKRIKPEGRPTMAEVGLTEAVKHLNYNSSSACGSDGAHIITDSVILDDSLLNLTNSHANNTDGTDGNVSNEDSDIGTSVTLYVRDIGTSTSVSASQNPSNVTPLNTPFSMPSSSGNSRDLSLPRHLSPVGNSVPSSTSAPSSKKNTYVCLDMDSSPISSLSSGRRPHSHQNHTKQANEKVESVMKLRHHIHILEQENLGKISRIAELEIELYLLKEQKLARLEHHVEKLEAENLRKNLQILQLEKRLQEACAHFRDETRSAQATHEDHERVPPGRSEVRVEEAQEEAVISTADVVSENGETAVE